MADETEGRDPTSDKVSAQPGGRSSRGPNPDPGGEVEPGGLVPPYDDRTDGTETSNEDRAEAVTQQLSSAKTGAEGRTASPADERPVQPDEVTDDEPASPKGVGKSSTRSGEDVAGDEGKEPGRREAGKKGASDRPVGVSDERDSGGVDPQSS